MSRLKFLLAIIIFGCTLFIVSHISLLKQSGIGTLHVINQVQFHTLDSYGRGHSNGNDQTKPLIKTDVVINDGGQNSKQGHTNYTSLEVTVPQNHSNLTVNESISSIEKGTSSQVLQPGNQLSKEELPLCNEFGVNLVGPLFVDQHVEDILDIERDFSFEFGGVVRNGGWFYPADCMPRRKVALIVPYRNRYDQLKVFLRHLHPILQRQQLFYRIIVVEQVEDDSFNRAALFNIGYVESLKMGDFDCFVFSDVDLLPEDDRNYYGCPTSPRHMSVAVDKFDYRLPYASIFGGVGAFLKEHFEDINGMSNVFWGWGGEDDDLYQRISGKGYHLTRPSMQIGRYTMIKQNHFQSSKASPDRMNLLKSSRERMVADGLNSLKYDLRKIDEEPLVTFVRVKLSKSMYV